MTRLDARPDSLDVSFRPGSTVTLNLNGPAGWLTSRSFTATLNGTSLSVSEDDDTLVVVASSGVTTALGSLGAKYPLVIHQSGGNDQIIGTWTASDGPALSRTVDATVLVDTIEVAVTILGSGTGGGGGGGVVDSVVAGTNVTVDSSDPANPIVSATGGTGGPPSGAAGGVLGGTYPNPSFAADMATQGELDAVAAAKENVGVAAALVDDLSGVTNQSQARTNLGLGTAATTAATAYATAAQGTKADTAVQPGSLASVATSGAYADLSGKPTLGSAAAASTSDFDAAGAAASAQAAAIAASQPVDSDLTAIAALTTTTFGRALLTQADAAATRTTLGLGSAATTASTAYDAAGAAASAQAASQPLDSDLTAIAALTTTSYGRAFLTLADAAAARTALGLGTAATTAATAYATAAQGATADTAVQPARTITAGTGLTGGGSLAADRTLAADFGAVAGKVTQGNDVRLSDARTPTAHAASHAAAGSDPVTLTQAQITGLGTALAAKADTSSLGTAAAANTGTSGTNVPTITQADARYVARGTFPVVIGVALSDETTAITTGTNKGVIRAPFAFTLTGVRSNLNTASSSGLPTVDINKNGTTMLSTKLTIDATELTSVTAATAPVISVSSVADDDEIEFDIDVAGTGAKGLKCWLIGTRTV